MKLGTLVGDALQDVRLALRSLGRSWSFTLTSVVSLAIGVAATSSVLALADAVAFRALPAAEPERLVALQEERSRGGNMMTGVTSETYDRFLGYRDATTDVFSGLAGHAIMQRGLRTAEGARPLLGTFVTGSYFDVLGIEPAAGALFDATQDRAGPGDAVAVIGYALWESEFAGDRSAIGQTIFLDGRAFTLVGVAPEGFQGIQFGYESAVWIPFSAARYPVDTAEPLNLGLMIFGRLAPGVTEEKADAALAVIGGQVAQGTEGPADRAHVDPLRFMMDSRVELVGFMAILFAIAAATLAIAAVNVAGMILARGVGRWREISIRAALGAHRGRIVRQLLTETLVLFGIGAGVGLWIAATVVRVGSRIPVPYQYPFTLDLRLDSRVVLPSLGLVLIAALVAGTLPALGSSSPQLGSRLREGGRGSIGGSRLGSGFVVAQVAISIVLLFGTGLFVKSFAGVLRVETGLRPEGVVVGVIAFPAQDFDPDRSRAFFAELGERLRALPGVEGVGFGRNTPFSGSGNGAQAHVGADSAFTQYSSYGEGWFETVGSPLLAGRFFTAADGSGTPNVAVVNQSFAHRLFGDADPIGRTFRLVGEDWQVVGLVPDGKFFSITEPARPHAYLDDVGGPWRSMNLYVRARGDAEETIRTVRRELAAINPDVALARARPLETDVHFQTLSQRMLAQSITGMALVAVLLATLGMYGLIAYQVARARREIGLRIALGAGGSEVVWLVLRRGLKLTGIGVGLAIPFGLAVKSFLIGVESLDPASLLLGPALLLAAAALAGWGPSLRAVRTNPCDVLQHDE